MPSPQSKGLSRPEFQCAVHKGDTIASFHFTLLRAAGKSQDQSLPLWAAFECGQAQRQAHEQQLWAAGKERSVTVGAQEAQKHNTHLSELPKSGSMPHASQIVYPLNQIAKGLRMKAISTHRAALCKSLLFRTVGKGNNFCSILAVLLGSAFSSVINKSRWLPKEGSLSEVASRSRTAKRGANDFVLQKFP